MNNRLKTLAFTSCAVVALATAAQAQDKAKFDIAGGDLKTALQTFATQTSQEVLFSTDIVAGRHTKGVSAETDPQTALVALLDGTGLTFNRTPTGTLLVVRASDPQSGSAAGDGAESGTVQALIVTAQKREENIQDVPIAMSAFTQEDLTKSQVTGGPDLMTQVPNFTFTKTNFTGYSIQIRGIGTQAVSATTDAAVAVAENNTPFIRNRFFEQEFYDLQRVEVLRGPQGTLYGRNATAGVVNIITAKPEFHYASRLSADVGNYNSTRLEGMLNLPLVDDHVALRLAGAWTKRDGYDLNHLTGNRIDGRDLWSTRVSLRVEPTSAVRANLIWEHFEENDDRLRSGKQLCHKDDRDNINGVPFNLNYYQAFHDPRRVYSQGCVGASLYSPDSYETPNGFSLPYYSALISLGLPGYYNFDPYLNATQSRNLRVIESSFEPKYKAKNDTGQLQVAVDLSGALTLTSETAITRDMVWSVEDFNRFTTTPHAFKNEVDPNAQHRPNLLSSDGVYCDPQLGCSDRVIAADLSTARSRQFSQEFRLSSDFDGPFNFSLGANFLRYDTEDKYYVFVNTLTLTSALSLVGAAGFQVHTFEPWGSGSSDNHRCMIHGLTQPVLDQVFNVDTCKYIEMNSISDIQDTGHNYFLSRNPYKLISYAVFGESYYNITDNLKLTAGLRWTVDRKEAPRIPAELFVPYSVGYTVAEVISQTWREPTGRLALDWKPDLSFTDDTLVYGSYSHGYKAGGANPPGSATVSYCNGCAGIYWGDALVAQSLTHPKKFEAEFVDAFELGSKNTLFDGRLTLNGDAFYYNYKGYQISEIVDRSAVNHNYDAKVWGLEIEADWRPLENLRLGFKGGYENTRVANGMYAIDLMDRTAGDPNWVVVRPFPTVPSNCIIPSWIATWPGGPNGGGVQVPGSDLLVACELAYAANRDPVTGLTYTPNPTESLFGPGFLGSWPNYPGWDPSTAPNHGEGIAKNLAGNSLPNAPRFTATVTGDYSMPLPNQWLLTLHGDFYYQSEAWARIFNDPGYDKLKAYTNVNVAAIFTNEDAGWKVMAYVKNVLDKDNITGAFLNSDDTGLTTNVFLNEPRLYGIRITKEWTGGSIWGGGNPNAPQPFRVELGGQVARHTASNETIRPDFYNQFSAYLDPAQVQNRDQDWGQGGSVRLTYSPPASGWWLATDVRWGKTSTFDRVMKKHVQEEGGCILGPPFDTPCHYPHKYWQLGMNFVNYPTDYANTALATTEDHKFVDFLVGADVGVGRGAAGKSKIGLGVGYADLKSTLRLSTQGTPSWEIPPYWTLAKYAQHHQFDQRLAGERTFNGGGPIASWEDEKKLVELEGGGEVDLSWMAKGGLLIGKQKTRIDGQLTDEYFNMPYAFQPAYYSRPTSTTVTPTHINRNKSATVPMIDLSLGLTYEVERLKVGAGYQWQRYFNAIDGGDLEHKSYDRTYEGPYFKVSVGFGG